MSPSPRYSTSRCFSQNLTSESNTSLPRKPCTTIQSIRIPISLSETNKWQSMQASKGTWVLLRPRRRKQCKNSNTYRSAWKARIVDFKTETGKRSVKDVLVQHVYSHSEVLANGGNTSTVHNPRCNYVYPSTHMGWEPVECIIGIICVIHAHIGVLQYEGRTHRSLADQGIFFYDSFYKTNQNNIGGEVIPLLLTTDWNCIDWPVPDTYVLEATRSKLFKDVQRSLRVTIPTKLVKISLFCPLTVYIDMFGACNVKVAKTMLICKDAATTQMLDNGWDNKEDANIQCQVALDSVLAKYMIATQTLIFSFWYRRSRSINGIMIPMDQEAASSQSAKVINIEVQDSNFSLLTVVAIRETCTLADLRRDIVDESMLESEGQFIFKHNGRQILPRREMSIICKDINTSIQLIYKN